MSERRNYLQKSYERCQKNMRILSNVCEYKFRVILASVVATTHWNGTRSLLTSAKLSVSYLVVEITRELDKEPSLY